MGLLPDTDRGAWELEVEVEFWELCPQGCQNLSTMTISFLCFFNKSIDQLN